MKARITREKLYPTSGKSYRFAWKWLYSVLGLDVELSGFDRLDSARNAAKRHGATSIELEWETKD